MNKTTILKKIETKLNDRKFAFLIKEALKCEFGLHDDCFTENLLLDLNYIIVGDNEDMPDSITEAFSKYCHVQFPNVVNAENEYIYDVIQYEVDDCPVDFDMSLLDNDKEFIDLLEQYRLV